MIGTVLSGRYEITGEIGRGGMGVVFRARDPLLNRDVAIKMISPGALGKKAEARIRREARLVAGLDHPSVVPIHDLGKHDGSLYLVMPLVKGDTLATRIQRRDLDPLEVVEIGIQLARALDHSHAKGIRHRDVKPSNVLVSQDGGMRARLMDFGLAQFDDEGDQLTGSHNLPGTAGYLSPEQVAEAGADLDGRSDLYSLGVVLYECLLGEPPFTGTLFSILYRISHEIPRSLRERGLDVDPELETLILRCLAKHPDERPGTGEELARLLTACRDRLRKGHASAGGSDAAGTAPDRPAVVRTYADGPLVGRREELAQLQERLAAALEGECQLVALGGGAGIGKRRLVGELEGLVRAKRLTLLRGRFVDWESAFPFQGLSDLIVDFFRRRSSTDASTPGVDLTDLAPDLMAAFPTLLEVPELRGSPQALPSRAAPGAAAAPPKEPTFIFELLARTLLRLSGGGPMVLVLENLQAARSALDAVRYLVGRLGPTPTLVLATYRTSDLYRGHPLERFLDGFAADPRFLRLELPPLSPTEIRRLIEVQMGTAALEVEMVERLHETTEGNPLFCRELLKILLETGGIERASSGRFTLSGDARLGTDVLPANIQQAEERRIERLGDEQHRLLSVASVLGKNFATRDLEELLEAAGGRDPDTDDRLDELLASGLLTEDRKSRRDRLNFASGVLRDLLHRGLSRRRRRSLHRRFARILERRHDGHLERVFPQLVDHFRAADRAVETVRYGLALARRSLDAFSPEEAIAAARAALEFVEDEDLDDGLHHEAVLLGLSARAHQRLGQEERALRDAERGAQLWADADPRGPEDVLEHAELCLLAAEIHWQGRRMDSVRTWVDRGLAPAGAAGAVDLLRRLLQLGIAVDSLRGSRADAEFLRRLRELEGGRGGPSDPMPGGRLVSGLTLPIRHLEPAEVLTLEEWEVALQMYECLVVAAGEGVLGGGLAETWTVSEDGTRFQFDLRRGLRFSDGSPLDAVAVRESLEHAARRTVADPTRPLPPALAPLLGIQDFLDGRSERIEGIEAHRQPEGRDRIVIHLTEALPIFPALLTDLRTAVVRPRDSALSLGTGPFRLDSRTASRCELVPNPEWRGTPPWLERLVVETFDGAGPLAKAAREGRVDLAHDLLPNDFETLGQSPRFKAGVLEAVKKNTYFAVLRGDSPRMTPQVRRALAGVVRTPDLVWRSLGRFAVPAVSLIPPGMLGHDAGRRRPSLATERARELLVASGVQLPLHLDALVHPLFFARLAPFLEALRAEWAAVGVELRAEPRSISEFLSLQRADAPPFDLVLSRWNAAYDDPDNFTFSLLDSELGLVRRFFSSPQADQLMRRARTEPAAADRRRLYRQLEDLVADEGLLVPLFHDVDTRLLAQGWRGLELRDATGYPSYGQVHRAPASRQPSVPSRGGELRVATPMILDTLDPAAGYFVHHHEQTLNIFETLVRIDAGARPKPWLAESLEILEGGRIFHFALRKGLRFHDGRLLTPRDVRYSFERLLRNSDLAAGALLKPIQGAGDFIRGQADSLAGFHIRSSLDLAIELDHPLAFFPTLLAHPCLAIVPEDVGPLDRRWQAGACGTGPFRIAGFAPGERLELERNPSYWRPGFPKTERLVFVHEPDPSKRLQAFRQGRVSVAADLRPEDAHALRREPQRVGEYRESPSLSTYFLGLCARRGPLSDPRARAALAASLDVDTLVRRTLGRSGVRARGLVPPGLLGWDTPMAEPEAAPAPSDVLDGTHLVMVQHPIFRRCFEAFAQRLEKQLRALGLELEIRTVDDVTEIQRLAAGDDVDLILSRWMSVYPDPDCLVSGLLHPRDGFLSPLCGSRELARLVEDGRRETDPALRHGIYRHLEETLAREHRVVPLFHEQSCRFSFPGVRGLRLGITTPEVRYDELMVGQDSGPA